MAGTREQLTYRQMDERSLRAAHLFYDLGLRAGDGIAIYIENHPRYFELCWAAQRSGLLYTPINSRLTAKEVAYIVSDCGAKLFITSHCQADVAAQLTETMPGVEKRLMLDTTITGYEAFETNVDTQPAKAVPHERAGTSMLYSSGTTGRPKGVTASLSGGPITMMPPIIGAIARRFGVARDCVYLSPAPLYHAAPLGFSMTVQTRGGTCIIMEKFDAEGLLRFIEEFHVTHVNLVPTMFVRLLKLPESVRNKYDLSSLKTVVHGAAPCPPGIKERMIDWLGPILSEYYSATESNVLCLIDSPAWLKHRGSVGKPVLGPVFILDEAGRELPQGQAGEIWSAAPTEFSYHNDPEMTTRTRNDRGWTTLGDLGYLDNEGYLYLTDRKAFTIISNGVNIYPREAEDVLILHPKVMDIAVIGVPDDERGEAVKAVVEPVTMTDAGLELEAELIAYCGNHLAGFKCPLSIDFTAELPRQENGKIYKRLLRESYWPASRSTPTQ